MKITAEPRSDQWNGDDFIAGPKTFTIAGVTNGKADQKYDIQLVEGEGRVWRPPLTMLRVMMSAWGDLAADWVGRRATLFRDPNVRFGPDVMGGIRISHLSHIPKPLTISVTVSKNKRQSVTVHPLPAAIEQIPLADLIEQCGGNKDRLRTLYRDQQQGGASTDDLALIAAAAEAATETESE